MNWDALGAVGDLVGGLAVLITLIYLALQVRHSRELLERNEQIALGQQYQTRAEITSANLRSMIDSQRIIEDYIKHDSGETLSERERRHVTLARRLAWLAFDNNHYQFQLGLIEEATWLSQLAALRREVANDPLFRQFAMQPDFGRSAFRELVAAIIADLEEPGADP